MSWQDVYKGQDDALGRPLVESVARDLERESTANSPGGVYPPFLQMVSESLLRIHLERGVSVSLELYRSLGGARELIGRYLASQLTFLQERRNEGRLVLRALAGTAHRLRRSASEIAADTGIGESTVEARLSELSSLRLVHASEGLWEIVHDFVAQRVRQDLSDPEEQEARTFRDLATAKAAAFARTRELLTTSEHLGLYAYRRRVSLAQDEVSLLFASYLAGRGPVAYYLAHVPSEVVAEWASTHLVADDDATRRNAFRFLIRRGTRFALGQLVENFGEYRLGPELARLMAGSAASTEEDVSLLMRWRRKGPQEVSDSAHRLLEQTVGADAHAWTRVVEKLARSRSDDDTRTLGRILMRWADLDQLPRYRRELRSRAMLPRMQAICALAFSPAGSDVAAVRQRLRLGRGRERFISALALASRYQLRHDRRALLSMLGSEEPEVVCGTLAAVEDARGGIAVQHLLSCFDKYPGQVAAAIARSVQPGDRAYLKNLALRLLPDKEAYEGNYARAYWGDSMLLAYVGEILTALMSAGGADEACFVLETVCRCARVVSPPELHHVVDAVAAKADRSLLPRLAAMLENQEFWRYYRERPVDRLPVVHPSNLYIVKRMIAFSLAQICGPDDWPLLRRMAFHSYWWVQMAAARAVARFGTEAELNDLIADLRGKPMRTADPDETPFAGTIRAICALDERLYMPSLPAPPIP